MENSGQPPPYHRDIGSRVLPSNDPEYPPPSYDSVVESQPEKYHPVQLVPAQVLGPEPMPYTTTPSEPSVHSYSNPMNETALGHSRPQPAPNQTIFVCQRNSGLGRDLRTKKRVICTVVTVATIILFCFGVTVRLLRKSRERHEQEMLKEMANEALPEWDEKLMSTWGDTVFEESWDKFHKEIADKIKVKDGLDQFDNDLVDNANVGNDFRYNDKFLNLHNLTETLVSLRKSLEMEIDKTIENMNKKKNSSEDPSEVDSNPSKLEETLKEVDKIMKWRTSIR